jgi:hypothetical protein
LRTRASLPGISCCLGKLSNGSLPNTASSRTCPFRQVYARVHGSVSDIGFSPQGLLDALDNQSNNLSWSAALRDALLLGARKLARWYGWRAVLIISDVEADMFRWLAGWSFARAMRNDLRRLTKSQSTGALMEFASVLAERMAAIEHLAAKGGIGEADVAAKRLAEQAKSVRLNAMTDTGPYSATGLEAGICETWALARSASFNGKITMRRFRKIDGMAFDFLRDTLGPVKLRDVLRRASSK